MRESCTQLNEAKSKPQIVLSHDWPNTIEAHGDTQALIRKKPFFKEEVSQHTPLPLSCCHLLTPSSHRRSKPRH